MHIMNIGTILMFVGEIQHQLAHHCPYWFYTCTGGLSPTLWLPELIGHL